MQYWKQHLIGIDGYSNKIKRVEIWVECDSWEEASRIVSVAFNVAEFALIRIDTRFRIKVDEYTERYSDEAPV